MMKTYARLRGLKRLLMPVPVLTPRLSSLLGGPRHAHPEGDRAHAGRGHAQRGDRARRRRAPPVRRRAHALRDRRRTRARGRGPRRRRDRVGRGVPRRAASRAPCRWRSARAASSSGATRACEAPAEASTRPSPASAAAAAGTSATPCGGCAALLDRLVGGVRHAPRSASPGRAAARRRARLLARRVGGAGARAAPAGRDEGARPRLARLRVRARPGGRGRTLRQTAVFEPRGLFGLVYWYALYPMHQVVFAGMIEAIGRRAEAAAARAGTADRRAWGNVSRTRTYAVSAVVDARAGPALARGDRPAALPADHRRAAAARSRTWWRRRSSTPSTSWA